MLDDITSNKTQFQGCRESACGYNGLISMISTNLNRIKFVEDSENSKHKSQIEI